MINTILFDLDGTLLDMDLDFFLRQYFKALTPKLAHLIPPEQFVPKLLQATEAMIIDINPEKTNKEIFLENFTQGLTSTEEELMPLFDDFYLNDFSQLKQYTKPYPLIPQIVHKVIEKGYKTVVATQPVFPYEAIKHRLNWAGVGELPFELISTYENSHFCKPKKDYFQEILNKLALKPEDCLMVGNDVDDDLPAGEMGIKTFLLTDGLLNRHNRSDYQTDFSGNCQELLRFVSNLPHIK